MRNPQKWENILINDNLYFVFALIAVKENLYVKGFVFLLKRLLNIVVFGKLCKDREKNLTKRLVIFFFFSWRGSNEMSLIENHC